MFPKARQEKLTVRELASETLVYDLERSKAHCLNRPSSFVWRHCDGHTSHAELAQLLREELGVNRAEELVHLALEQLGKRNLLEVPVAPLSREARLGRREILKQMALAATLPLVMTLTAPRAAAAESSTVVLKDCTGVQNFGPCGPGVSKDGVFTPQSANVCCKGVCVTPETAQQCGQCGTTCPAGQDCVNGVCQAPA